MDLNAIPSAPASTDNGTVILWVVGVLFIGGIFVYRQLAARIAANETESKAREKACQDERAQAWAKVEEREKELRELLQGTVAKGLLVQQQATEAMAKMATSIDKLTQTIEDSSGQYPAQKR